METATVILEGDYQTVRLPKSVHLPATVLVAQVTRLP
jgi:virulence-associated protein VagC